MVNVEQITSRLSMMPDQALQQYAMMNKNDPYILALAVSESNRRKQMRAAAVPEAREMPKVADQAVASMLPEQQGIGSLPAGDMQFADGGLVAFADGGEVERYQAGGTITPALRAQYEREAMEMGYGQRMQFSPEVRAVVDQIQAPRRAQEQSFMQREQERMLQGPALLDRSNLPKPAAPTIPFNPATQPTVDRPAGLGAAMDQYLQKTEQRADTVSRGAPSAAPSAPAPGPAKVSPDMITRAKTQAGQIYDDSGITKLMKEKEELVDKRAEELREGLKTRPTEKAFLGLERSLKKEAEGEGAEKEKATGLAIFKAGLAMMSGSSPHAFQNIGKGALVGAEEYGQAIKDFKKAAKDREKLMAEIEEKRRLQAVGDWEAAQAVDTKISELRMGIKDKMIDATVKATGVKAEVAGNLIGKELDFNRQVQLKGMPSYSDTQEKSLINQWLARPENKGKTELDARLELGIGVGKGTASISDRIRGYQTILNDITATDEEKANARIQLNALISGQPRASAGPATPTTKEQYDKLPRGSVYTAPDGTQRIKG